MSRHRVVFVTGATATGKSAWALETARATGAVIVNCDSVQVYRGPVIGSNLPSPEEFAAVPHHLYSYVEAPHEMTAGEFRRDFFALLDRLPPASRVLVVGGTGFYFQALEKGMFDAPPVEPSLAAAVRAEAQAPGGLARLWDELRAADPATADRLEPEDQYRICRAVEILRTGARPSDLRAAFRPQPFPHDLLKTQIVCETSDLREDIARRTRRMLEAGLIEETRGLLGRAPADWAPLHAVGYAETTRFLREGLSRAWLEDEITLRTVQLARRQAKWFKRDPNILPFPRAGGAAAFHQACLRFFGGADKMGSP